MNQKHRKRNNELVIKQKKKRIKQASEKAVVMLTELLTCEEWMDGHCGGNMGAGAGVDGRGCCAGGWMDERLMGAGVGEWLCGRGWVDGWMVALLCLKL